MLLYRTFRVRAYQRGVLFVDRVPQRLLHPGRHWVLDPLHRARVEVCSVRDPFVQLEDLDLVVRAGLLADQALVLDLADHQRALVTVDGRFAAVLAPGLHALWTVFRKVTAEVVDIRALRFESERLPAILEAPGGRAALEAVTVEAGHAGLLFRDGRHEATLGPGTHAFWKNAARVRFVAVDLREQVADIAGQEIMTADKVTLRLNAVLAYRVTDPLAALTAIDDFRQALYREAQLALRAVIGTRELDALLAEKDQVARELESAVKVRASGFGLEVRSLGIRDVILPGEMKDLLNKVTEARKAAEAALITRREETAAMRSQANTARILEGNPTLMRLRELEVLEKVADKARLNVLLGEKGLADTVVRLV